MKRKLLFACTALLGLSAWAQTKTDVTDKITNPSFEANEAVVKKSNLTEACTDITGWTITTTNTGFNNEEVLDANTDNSSAFGKRVTPKDGDYYFFARQGWFGNGVNITMQTTTAELEAGEYELTVDYMATENSSAQDKLKFSVSQTEELGSSEYDFARNTSSSYFSSGENWQSASVVFTVTEAGTATIEVKAILNGNNSPRADFILDNFQLNKLEGVDLTAWNNAKANAEEVMGSYTYEESDEEMAALMQTAYEAYDKADPTTTTQMNEMVQTLNDAVAAFVKLAENRLLEQTYSGLTTFINNISEEYPNKTTELFPGDLTKWTNSTYVGNNGKDHWSGVQTYYYEQTSAQWGQDSWSIGAEKTVTLPAGKYCFVVTARASTGVTSTMTVNGDEVELSHKGASGYGIATDGTATYNLNATYANTNGRGWEYAYSEFTLTEETEVTISFASSADSKYNWVSIANPVLYYNDDAKAAMEYTEALAELQAALENAVNISENIGDDVFQYNQDEYDEYDEVLSTASLYLYGKVEGATLEDVQEQTEAVKAAVVPSVNQPEEAIKGALKLVYSGWTYDKKYVTAYANESAQGGYSMKYDNKAATNSYVWTMTPDGEDNVTLSFVDGENTIYMCTGTVYGGNAYQLRVTDNAEQALKVKVIPSTDTKGIVRLYNTEANQYIGSQDAGVFTVGSHNDFVLETTWTKTGYGVPAADWDGFLSYAYRQPFTITGTYGTNDLKIEDGFGDDITLTCDADDNLTAFALKGTAAGVGKSDYAAGNFCFYNSDNSNDYTYYTYIYTGWSYANADEQNGYVTLSFWGNWTGSYTWDSSSYVNIEWADETLADFPAADVRTAAAEAYGTICEPYSFNIAGATLYTVDGFEKDGTTLTLTAIEANEYGDIQGEAGKAYVYQATAANPYIYFNAKATAEEPEAEGILVGVFEDTDAEDGMFVLQNQEENGFGFYLIDSEEQEGPSTIPANRAYIPYSAVVNPLVKAFGLGGNATAIQAVEALTSGKAQIYDINGRQLQKLQKGINIVNGVKVLVK